MVFAWFTFIAVTLLFVSVFNDVVDPFQQYRKATLYPMLFKKNQRYINPGLAKTYDYESIIIGSSMTENFLIDKVEKILSFKKAIKFCISGGTAHEEYQTLSTAFRHRKINKVLYGLDIYAFRGTPDRDRHGVHLPIYLYDDNIFNDYHYLLNIDTFKNSLQALAEPYWNKNNILYDYNHMWQWQHEFTHAFGTEKVLKKWLASHGSSKKFQKDLWATDKLELSFNKNLLSLIQAHPETEFILFYPPYSVLTFHDWQKEGVLKSSIAFKRYIFDKIKRFDNVKLYDFQVAKEIITNLDNYRDYSHYHQKINTWMLEEMAQDHYRVREDNVDDYGKKLLEITEEYEIPTVSHAGKH